MFSKLILLILSISLVSQAAYTPTTTLTAETTKVIGTVNISAAQTLTCNAGTGTMAVSLASIPVGSGVALASWQSSSDATLTSINSKITAVNTGAVVVSSSALPSGAATAANQTTEITQLSFIDGSLTDIAAAIGTHGSPPNSLRNIVAGWDGTNVRTLKTDSSGELQVDVLTMPSITIGTSALPSGASTSAWQASSDASLVTIAAKDFATQTTLSALNTKIPSNLTVTSTRLLVDGSGVTQPVSGTFWQATQPISAVSLPLPTLAATSSWQASSDASLTTIASRTPALGQATMANSVPVAIASNQSAIPISSDATILAIKTAVEIIDNAVSGTGNNVSQINGVTPLMGAGNTGTGSLRVTIATDQATIPVTEVRPASATLANVASSASNVTLQASNTARRVWKVFNDSTAVLYVKFGATASATSYTVQIAAGGFYEMEPPVYTGIIDGIWASANGNARVTEY